MRLAVFVFLALLPGCAISPVPKNIITMHRDAHQKTEQIQHLLQPGDIIFRLGDARIAGGKLNFSELVAKISDSDFSHAVIVCSVTNGEAVVADVSILGLQRYYLVDWLIDGQKNIVVKRLSSAYQHYLPLILEELTQQIAEDPLYDDTFGLQPDKFYCTKLVDHCFRQAGLPLAELISIRDLPNFRQVSVIAGLASMFAGIDLDTGLVVAGNDEIGLFSSPYLETVIDLR